MLGLNLWSILALRDKILMFHDRHPAMAPDSPHANLVRAAALAGFQRLVRDLGGDPDAILRACALDPRDLADPDRYLPGRHVAQAIEAAATTLGVGDFGLRLSAAQELEALGLLVLIMQSASSVREGLMLGAKYVHFHNAGLGYRIFMDPASGLECVEVFQRMQAQPGLPELPELPELPQVTEICVAYQCRLIAMLSDGKLQPAAIHFRHGPIAGSARYRQHLGQVPRFHAEFDGISIDPLAWRQKLPRHNRLLQDFVERFLLGPSSGQEASVAEQVGNVLGNLVRIGMTDLATVARAVGQHPRTLQRRLHAEGVQFEQLRDAARMVWARQLLAQPGLKLPHIAQLLGFSDQSVLTRACRRWFGAAPRRLRQGAASLTR